MSWLEGSPALVPNEVIALNKSQTEIADDFFDSSKSIPEVVKQILLLPTNERERVLEIIAQEINRRLKLLSKNERSVQPLAFPKEVEEWVNKIDSRTFDRAEPYVLEVNLEKDLKVIFVISPHQRLEMKVFDTLNEESKKVASFMIRLYGGQAINEHRDVESRYRGRGLSTICEKFVEVFVRKNRMTTMAFTSANLSSLRWAFVNGYFPETQEEAKMILFLLANQFRGGEVETKPKGFFLTEEHTFIKKISDNLEPNLSK